MDAADSEAKACDTQNQGVATRNELVLYDPSTNIPNQNVSQDIDDPKHHNLSSQNSLAPGIPSQAVGAFTVQCAACFKWRLIPSKEKYEEIRERILEHPFVCDQARDWRPDISCDNPPDIQQDGSRLWAIDKPSIAQPPPGWERLIRIRAQGSTKFADVYYVSPTGKKLRSMVEVEKHLCDHPEYISQGVNIGQFSFRTPRPLWQNYTRKRPCRTNHNVELVNSAAAKPLNTSEVAPPLSWESPSAKLELRIGSQTPSDMEEATSTEQPSKKDKRVKIKFTRRQIYGSPLFAETEVDPEDPDRRRASRCEW